MATLTRVIGIGSRYGDDRAGWLVATRLASTAELSAEVITVLNPLEILENVADCQKLIVVDAAHSDRSALNVRRLCWPTDEIEISNSHSSHGVGVAYALQLAQQQGDLPKEVVVFAIECGVTENGTDEKQPSEHLLLQVYEAERQIRAELELKEENANA